MNRILLYFALKYQGDWDKIYKALDSKEKVSIKELEKLDKRIKEEDIQYITLLDIEYLNDLKQVYKPPFVLFYKGDWKNTYEKERLSISGDHLNDLDAIDDLIKQIKDQVIISTRYPGVEKYLYNNTNGFSRIILEPRGILGYSCDLQENDLLISESWVKIKTPTKEHYKGSNRIASAISSKLIMVSHSKAGGSNNLINHFLNIGKDVYAINNEENKYLIKQGAIKINTLNDI